MKKFRIITALFSLIAIGQNTQAQTLDSNGNGTTVIVWPHRPLLFLGAGVYNPETALKNEAHFKNFTAIKLDAYIPIISKNKSSIGVNTGFEYSFDNSTTFGTLPNPYQVTGQSSPPVITVKGTGSPKAQGFKFEAGPSAMIKTGDSGFGINPSINLAYLTLNHKSFTATQTSEVNGTTYHWDLLKQEETKTNGLGMIPKLRLIYMFGKIGVWMEGSYTLGPKVKTLSTLYHPEGNIHQDGTYSLGQMNFPTYTTSENSTRYRAFGISGGIVIELGGGENPPSTDRRLKGKVIRMGDKGIVRRDHPLYVKNPENDGTLLSPNTGTIPQRAHLRIFCKDGKKILKYYDYKGNLYNASYTDLPCNNKTWPINGVEGDLSTDGIDKTMTPIKWDGTISGMFDIKNPDIFVNADSGIERLMKTINDMKTYQAEIKTDAIQQKYLSIIHKDTNEFIRETLPIDESGPMNHVINVDIRCVGSCNGGNYQPCALVEIPQGGFKCQDCGTFSTNTTCRSVTGWSTPSGWHHNLFTTLMPLVDENSSTSSPSVSDLIKRILPKDYTAKTVEVNTIDHHQYISILASNGIKSIILVNQLENGLSNTNWMGYFSKTLTNEGKNIPNMIKNARQKTIQNHQQDSVGQIILFIK